jgi:hypothetical protein
MAGMEQQHRDLAFRLNRKDLYDAVRISAGQRVFRKVAPPALGVFVFLGHSIDGNYLKGFVWAVAVGFLYWGLSQIMFLLHVYGAGNETLLAPQQIRFQGNRLVVSSEYGTEEFDRPVPSDVKVTAKYLAVPMGKNSLVFLRRSFEKTDDFDVLKDWLTGG